MFRSAFCLTLSILFCLQTAGRAQSWQWAKRIGSAGVGTGQGGAIKGSVDVATDASGNVYILGNEPDSLLNADSHNLSGWGGIDIVLTSFTCDGTYRWSKVIGTSLDSDNAVAVKTDYNGAVYVCGELSRYAAGGGGWHIGGDTVVPATSRTMFLAKWDATGAFQWLRLSQPDTIGNRNAYYTSHLLGMDIDGQGFVHLLMYVTPGLYAGALVMPSAGACVVKYTPAGSYAGGVALPIVNGSRQATELGVRFRYDGLHDRYVMTGSAGFAYYVAPGNSTVTVGLNTIKYQGAFLATFHASTGALDFFSQGLSGDQLAPPGIALDATGSVYLTSVIRDSGTFNGVTFYNPRHYPSRFAMKMGGATLAPA